MIFRGAEPVKQTGAPEYQRQSIRRRAGASQSENSCFGREV